MAEIYRGQQGAASKCLGKKRYPFPAPPSSILTEPESETQAIILMQAIDKQLLMRTNEQR
jgi:hypothetical protein